MAVRSSASASAGGLSEPDAVAAVGRDPVEDGRRPLPSSDDADDRRVRQAERGHQRVGLGLVAAGLVRLERPAEHEQLVERRDAFAALRCVRGPARNGQPERDRPGMGDDDVEIGRLGDDREVAGRAGPDRGQRPLPAVLLGRDEGDEELAVQPLQVAGRRRAPGSRRGSRRRRPSCRTPHGRRPRRRGSRRPTDPTVQVAGSPGGTTSRCPDRITPPPAGPSDPPDDDRQRRPGHLLARPVRVGPDGGGLGRVRPRRPDPGRARASAAHAATASSLPVMLGIRTSACRSAISRSRSIARASSTRGASATEDRPGHAGRPARAVDPDLAGRVGVDLAAGGGQGGGRPRVALGQDDDPGPDGQHVAAERRELLVRHLDQPDAQVARGAATARPAGAAGRRPPGRRRPAR